MISSAVKNSWKYNFADFRDLVLILQKFLNIHRKTCQTLFLLKLQPETLAQRFSCEFFKIFKDTFFPEHLWMATSVLK